MHSCLTGLYIYIHLYLYVCVTYVLYIYVYIYITYKCMYVCMYVCLYVCMYVCVYIYIYSRIYILYCRVTNVYNLHIPTFRGVSRFLRRSRLLPGAIAAPLPRLLRQVLTQKGQRIGRRLRELVHHLPETMRDAQMAEVGNQKKSFGGIPNSRNVLFLQIFLKRAAKPSAGKTSAGFPSVK